MSSLPLTWSGREGPAASSVVRPASDSIISSRELRTLQRTPSSKTLRRAKKSQRWRKRKSAKKKRWKRQKRKTRNARKTKVAFKRTQLKREPNRRLKSKTKSGQKARARSKLKTKNIAKKQAPVAPVKQRGQWRNEALIQPKTKKEKTNPKSRTEIERKTSGKAGSAEKSEEKPAAKSSANK